MIFFPTQLRGDKAIRNFHLPAVGQQLAALWPVVDSVVASCVSLSIISHPSYTPVTNECSEVQKLPKRDEESE